MQRKPNKTKGEGGDGLEIDPSNSDLSIQAAERLSHSVDSTRCAV